MGPFHAIVFGMKTISIMQLNSFQSRVQSQNFRFALNAEEGKTLSKVGRDKTGLWFASEQSLSYLDGTLPGDYGFDPLGLYDPESKGFAVSQLWLQYAEVIHARWAMLGFAGCIAPEILGRIGVIPAESAVPWFKSGVIPPAGTFKQYW